MAEPRAPGALRATGPTVVAWTPARPVLLDQSRWWLVQRARLAYVSCSSTTEVRCLSAWCTVECNSNVCGAAALTPKAYQSPVDNVAYTLYYNNLNWADARFVCRFNALDLATISSDAQAADLNIAFKSFYDGYNQGYSLGFWTGGSDADKEGAWTWSDGTPFVYTRWGTGENVAGDSEDCLVARNINGTWADDACSSSRPFMCSPPGEDLLAAD
jgi:hypothetical protein